MAWRRVWRVATASRGVQRGVAWLAWLVRASSWRGWCVGRVVVVVVGVVVVGGRRRRRRSS
ncbi:hypothetical protein ACXZ9C_10645 [Streptococcus agalactiae]